MPAASRSFTVSPPPTVVVDYLKDFGHAEQWNPHIRTCERIDSGPVAEGAYWHNAATIFGITAELTYELEELTDRRIVFIGENAAVTAVDTITVDKSDAGSVVTYEAELRMHGTARLLTPLMKRAFEKRARDTGEQMTRVLDALVTNGAQRGGASR